MTPEFFEPPKNFDAEAYLEAAAAALELPIDPAHRDGVLKFLDFTARMANSVMDFELPEDTDPAPIFRP